MAAWRDRGEDAERTYVVTSSSFQHVIVRDLRSGCDRNTFSGKYDGTVVEHSCKILRVACAADAASATPTASATAPVPPPTTPGSTFREALRGGGEGPEMVVIPAGSFRMGCVIGRDVPSDCDRRELPAHRVAIAEPFALSVYEATFADWEACANAGGCNQYRPEDGGWGRGNRPVINVSWEDARSYASWLSRQTGATYRLPSESEWEYAARAGTQTPYSWGDAWEHKAPPIGRNRANCGWCGSRWDNDRTAPAGSFPPNPWGLYDMHGNVWEWTEDCWNSSYRGAPSDGSAWLRGDCSVRMLRGGAWFSYPVDLLATNRSEATIGNRYSGGGFRVARTLTP